MTFCRSKSDDCRLEEFLDKPETCALYLTDALETSKAQLIAEVLGEIGRARASKVRPITPRADMSLSEVMHILEAAGIKLVARPAGNQKA